MMDFKAERVGRGLHALSGKIVLNFDINEGDSNELEVQLFRSAKNMNDFRILPLKIYRTHLFNILNTFYKDAAMANFKNCSNLPQFKKFFEPPLKSDTYYMDRCLFDESGFPNYVVEGFYKVMVRGYGPAEWTMVLISQIETIF
ncbi:uncharacterized protein LOC101897439 [Musca domestica]|uniref:Uncharacterized protein LOC101897439 n=1 Tax=Musca domestica TaxID=7370 RepID=A0A9J7IB33_MUSDO|nr:uncharacterized protein LOC101897439 [Musca domestica]